jgi:hypothetical protein
MDKTLALASFTTDSMWGLQDFSMVRDLFSHLNGTKSTVVKTTACGWEVWTPVCSAETYRQARSPWSTHSSLRS